MAHFMEVLQGMSAGFNNVAENSCQIYIFSWSYDSSYGLNNITCKEV